MVVATAAGCDLALICNQSLNGGQVLDVMLDTLDQAQALALTDKASTQAGLRNAVKQYRLTRGI